MRNHLQLVSDKKLDRLQGEDAALGLEHHKRMYGFLRTAWAAELCNNCIGHRQQEEKREGDAWMAQWKSSMISTISVKKGTGAKDANITCDQTKGGRHREPSKGGIDTARPTLFRLSLHLSLNLLVSSTFLRGIN